MNTFGQESVTRRHLTDDQRSDARGPVGGHDPRHGQEAFRGKSEGRRQKARAGGFTHSGKGRPTCDAQSHCRAGSSIRAQGEAGGDGAQECAGACAEDYRRCDETEGCGEDRTAGVCRYRALRPDGRKAMASASFDEKEVLAQLDRQIHEAVNELWPSNRDLAPVIRILRSQADDLQRLEEANKKVNNYLSAVVTKAMTNPE